MGWGRMLFLGDWGQQWDIHDTQDQVARLRQELRTLRSDSPSGSAVDRKQDADIAALQAENDELRLYLAMLAQTLIRKGVVTHTEIGDLVKIIDPE